jgi:biopolymer transport protein ExbD
MKLPDRRRRTRPDDHLIPLINVIFLMLIFFMIVGQIRPAEALRVEPPESQQEQAAAEADPDLTLAADGRLALGDRVLAREALPAALRDRQAAAAGTAPAPLTLKADAAVPAAVLRETLALLAAAGIAEVRLLTIAAARR